MKELEPFERKNYNYLGILEVEIKGKNEKIVPQTRTRKLLETMLCNRNLIKGMNTC